MRRVRNWSVGPGAARATHRPCCWLGPPRAGDRRVASVVQIAPRRAGVASAVQIAPRRAASRMYLKRTYASALGKDFLEQDSHERCDRLLRHAMESIEKHDAHPPQGDAQPYRRRGGALTVAVKLRWSAQGIFRSFTMNALPDDTAFMVQARACQLLQMPTMGYFVETAGSRMRPGDTLEELGVDSGATLLMLRDEPPYGELCALQEASEEMDLIEDDDAFVDVYEKLMAVWTPSSLEVD